MFSVERFKLLILVLTLAILFHISLLFLIYDDYQFALTVPILTGLVGIFSGITYELTVGIGSFVNSITEFDTKQGLLPATRFFVGLFWPLLFAWDDILTQSDELRMPWFWLMATTAYLSFFIGIILVRNRTMQRATYIKERYEEIKSRNQDSENHTRSESFLE